MRLPWIPVAAVAALLLVPAARADGYSQYGPFAVQPDGSASLAAFEVGPAGSANRLFESIAMSAFGTATLQVQGLRTIAEGADASLAVHDNPHALLVVTSNVPNAVTFTLAPDVGAIPRGRWASVGDEDTQGALVLLGTRSWTKSGDRVTAELGSGERAVFRATVGGGDLAPLIADGRVVADVHLGAEVDTITYTAASVEASLAAGFASVRVSGATRGQMVAITAPRGLLDPARLAVDGTTRLTRHGTVEELEAAGSGFVVHADAQAVEVLVLDDLSAAGIRLGALGPSLEAVLAVGLAIVTFLVATVALGLRRRGAPR